MSDPIFQRTAFPNPLETADDYEKACAEFVMPFLAGRSQIVKDLMDEMSGKLGEEELDKEVLDAHVSAITKASTFPEEINEFMAEVTALEQKLESEGAFNEESG